MGRDWLPLNDETALMIHAPVRRPRLIDVLNAVALASGISKDELLSERRSQPIAGVRQLATYILRQECVARTLPAIERFLNRDNTTVIHGCNKADERIAADEEYRELYEAAKQHLHSVRRAA